jgi:hypothetical protein
MIMTQEDIEQILKTAERSFKQGQGYTGQQMSQRDTYGYHVIISTVKRFWKSDLVKENQRLRKEVGLWRLRCALLGERLEDCEKVRDQLVGLTSQSQSQTGNKIPEQK